MGILYLVVFHINAADILLPLFWESNSFIVLLTASDYPVNPTAVSSMAPEVLQVVLK